MCTNTVSSFNCSCNSGFTLNADGATCDGQSKRLQDILIIIIDRCNFAADIDECSTSNGGCDQVCTNTVGSFNCSCADGFSLNTDRATCDGQF